jgi:class 3 adenylate cyclase
LRATDTSDVVRAVRKSFEQPDSYRDVGRGELRIVELGDFAIGWIRYEPGWRWIDDVKPKVGTETCMIHHVGICISGRLHVDTADGVSIEIGPEDAFDVAADHLAYVVGDEPWVSVDFIGRRHFGAPTAEAVNRFLATILFVDIVGSTEMLARIGDRAWRDLLAEHNALARLEIEHYRGTEVGTIGDGLVATFDTPSRAVRAAAAIRREAKSLELEIRAGIHTGEVERVDDDVRGIAVHHAARVAAVAGPGEILVSTATRSLLSGGDLELESVGARELKGIDQPDELFRANVSA